MVGRTSLFAVNKISNADYYDCSPRTPQGGRSNLDFSQSVVPVKQIEKSFSVATTELTELPETTRTKPNRQKTLWHINKRHGREDNLMYR